ncbi:MAG: hypothetical protein ACLGI3_11670, partial [Actinomycetes bacterium]
MRLSAPRTAVAAALAAGLLAATSASAAVEESETRLFLSAEGCGATQEPGTLSVEKNPDAGSDGCGSIGGLPFDEVFHQLDAASPMDFTTTSGDGVPLTLDPDRDATGVFATRSWTGGAGAVGEVTVDLVLNASYRDDTNRPRSLALGSGTFTVTGSPTSVVTSVPFTFDLPDTAADKVLTG